MGWAMFVAVAAAAGLFLTLVRFPGRMWTVAATAVTLGAAGYAWQGSPTLAGAPVAATGKAGEIDPSLVALREAMFGKFGTYVYSYATLAESMTSRPVVARSGLAGGTRTGTTSRALSAPSCTINS